MSLKADEKESPNHALLYVYMQISSSKQNPSYRTGIRELKPKNSKCLIAKRTFAYIDHVDCRLKASAVTKAYFPFINIRLYGNYKEHPGITITTQISYIS